MGLFTHVNIFGQGLRILLSLNWLVRLIMLLFYVFIVRDHLQLYCQTTAHFLKHSQFIPELNLLIQIKDLTAAP